MTTYIVQEESPNPAQEGSINRRQSTTEPAPFPGTIMGDRGIGVLQVGEHHNPMVRDLNAQVRCARTATPQEHTHEPRDEVQLHSISESHNECPAPEDVGHSNEANVGNEDQEPLFGLE